MQRRKEVKERGRNNFPMLLRVTQTISRPVLAEIIHGLLMEEADCPTLTRSVSFEVALLRFNPEGFQQLAGGCATPG